jgi:polysaccharide pyruvyl transferase WcaK-like protein
MACYRSYRDNNSRKVASDLLQRAARDSVVPDVAFSLPSSELPSPSGIRSIAREQTVVAISPIAYAKPESWPHQDGELYNRYLQQMARVVSHLIGRDYILVMVWSSVGDKSVISELVERLDGNSRKRLACQMRIPGIMCWKDFVGALLDVDFLIASRLHSTIFGFLTRTPTLAISFDPKVDWVMKDLDQKDYLLRIHDFTSEDVIQTLDLIQSHKDAVVEKIVTYQHRIYCDFMYQYDRLAKLVATGR